MSQIKVNTINDASGGNNAVLYGPACPNNSMGFRNRIINGDMRIAQRGTTFNSIADFTYTVDRWLYQGASSRFNIVQNGGGVTPPAGYTNYLGLTVASAATPSSGDYFRIQQRIEGFNVADLGWGAAGAQSVTLSFWVRSSLTGTFGGSVTNSASNRSYPFPYTINAANTWEQKTVTIPGDTTGTWLTDSGIGILLGFSLGSGSSFTATANTWGATGAQAPTGAQYVVSTNGATFFITGVQLEAGSVATPFERRDYGRELIMCQRYFQKSFPITTAPADGLTSYYDTAGSAFDASSGYIPFVSFNTNMRTAPTVSFYNTAGATSGRLAIFKSGVWTSLTSAAVNAREFGFRPSISSSGMTAGYSYPIEGNWTASAEL